MFDILMLTAKTQFLSFLIFVAETVKETSFLKVSPSTLLI
jgi:hypothetical protein